MKKNIICILCTILMLLAIGGCAQKTNNSKNAEIEVGDKFLPIGSIVVLKGGEKTLMIYGRTQKIDDNPDLSDYIAVPYPEGNISKEYIYYFNHENIEKVIYKGYVNDKEVKLEKNLHEQLDKTYNK